MKIVNLSGKLQQPRIRRTIFVQLMATNSRIQNFSPFENIKYTELSTNVISCVGKMNFTLEN